MQYIELNHAHQKVYIFVRLCCTFKKKREEKIALIALNPNRFAAVPSFLGLKKIPLHLFPSPSSSTLSSSVSVAFSGDLCSL
jgi:hypothetical protein